MTTTVSTFSPDEIQFKASVIRMALRRNNNTIRKYFIENILVKKIKIKFRVLGFSANMFLPTINSYKGLVHSVDEVKKIGKTISERLSLSSKTTTNIQFKIRKKTGVLKWVNNTISVERDAIKIPVKCVVNTMDIANLKEVKATLEKNRRVNELVDYLTNYIVEIDSENRVIDTWTHKENEYRIFTQPFYSSKVSDVFFRKKRTRTLLKPEL